MLKTQITQQASSSSKPSSTLPSKPKSNLRKQCNAMILRGHKQLEGPKGVENDEHLRHMNDDKVATVEKEKSTPYKDVINSDMPNSNELLQNPKPISLKPFTPPLLFPQRIAKAKLDL